MKVAILCESPADEAAIRILVTGVLGEPAQAVEGRHLAARGWQSVVNLLPTVVRALHYQSDAEALVVVVDSDASPLHGETHVGSGAENPRCRVCQLLQEVSRVPTASEGAGSPASTHTRSR
jgi:hypothetical protein